MQYDQYQSPIGPILLASRENVLKGVWLNRALPSHMAPACPVPVLEKTKAWLDSYFFGQPESMDFSLAPEGTAFQRLVWQRLLEIPYGQTVSYGAIAREMAAALGKPRMSAQAVGQAVGKNPISILIPCHRVVGSRGQLTGYAGGLENKIWLLAHEGGPLTAAVIKKEKE